MDSFVASERNMWKRSEEPTQVKRLGSPRPRDNGRKLELAELTNGRWLAVAHC